MLSWSILIIGVAEGRGLAARLPVALDPAFPLDSSVSSLAEAGSSGRVLPGSSWLDIVNLVEQDVEGVAQRIKHAIPFVTEAPVVVPQQSKFAELVDSKDDGDVLADKWEKLNREMFPPAQPSDAAKVEEHAGKKLDKHEVFENILDVMKPAPNAEVFDNTLDAMNSAPNATEILDHWTRKIASFVDNDQAKPKVLDLHMTQVSPLTEAAGVTPKPTTTPTLTGAQILESWTKKLEAKYGLPQKDLPANGESVAVDAHGRLEAKHGLPQKDLPAEIAHLTEMMVSKKAPGPRTTLAEATPSVGQQEKPEAKPSVGKAEEPEAKPSLGLPENPDANPSVEKAENTKKSTSPRSSGILPSSHGQLEMRVENRLYAGLERLRGKVYDIAEGSFAHVFMWASFIMMSLLFGAVWRSHVNKRESAVVKIQALFRGSKFRDKLFSFAGYTGTKKGTPSPASDAESVPSNRGGLLGGAPAS